MRSDESEIPDYRCRIYYEDVDAGGICYHSRYLNFCERARSEFFFSRGSSPLQEAYHFVVKHIDADFFAPARFGEEIRVSSSIIESKRVSITMLQRVYDPKERLLFSMTILLACLKGDRISKIPESYSHLLGIEK